MTHYHLADRAPFLNLSDLEDAHLGRVLAGLHGRSHRVFGRRYMELRRRTEAMLRERFVAAGGRPERTAPHYFVLGASRWFAGLAPGMRAVVLAVADLPEHATSVTCPDSFVSMGLGPQYGLPHEPRPYHGRVYRLHELDDLVARHGLPADEPGPYEGYQHRTFERFVEVQLWCDEPVRHLLAT